jgi:hypothetical protein
MSTQAFADDAACLDAAAKGQRLRRTHKLVEAREQLRVCAAAACPTVVQSDCAGWLATVEKALPSVVVTAKDDAGASLVDVNVTVDGQPFAARLDGQALSIDPGSHTFHFEAPGGSTLDQLVVVPEGEQNERVAVVLPKRSSPSPPPAANDTGAAEPPHPPPSDRGGAHGGAPWKTVGWVLGGAGVVGLGVGTAFGILAISDHNAAKCNASHVCLTGPLSNARGAALASDIGLAAGGVLFATGLGLVIFAPHEGGEERAATAAVIVPVIVPGGGGLAAAATWR